MGDRAELGQHTPLPCVGARHVQAALLFTGMLLAFSMRVNMSVAIVAMTQQTFKWSVGVQSMVLSSFFWGYVWLQVPGGELARRLGGRALVSACVAANAALSLCTPLAALHGGWRWVCGARVLQGLAQGVLYPSVHHLISHWIPPEERSRLGTFIYAGGQLGTALQLAAAGVIAAAWGWAAIFYVSGALGVLWAGLYALLGADGPERCGTVSRAERDYILRSLGHARTDQRYKTPWRSIFTSVPFYSLVVVHSAQSWGFWTLMTEIPSYFSSVLGVDIAQTGAMSALPYAIMFALSFPLGAAADLARRRRWLGLTASRKLSNTIGHWGPAAALVALAYAPPGDVSRALGFLCLVVGLNAGHYTGYLLVHIDMAPNFAGTLMGITNCVANGVSILAPLAAGLFLQDESSPAGWRGVFLLAAGVYLLGNLLYVAFGSSERQLWDQPNTCNKTEIIEAFSRNEEKVI